MKAIFKEFSLVVHMFDDLRTAHKIVQFLILLIMV